MISIKAFLKQNDKQNNKTNEVSLIGELSSYCSTFSRDITSYVSSALTNPLELLVLKAIDLDNKPVVLENTLSDNILSKLDYLTTFFKTHSVSTSANDFLTAFMSQYPTEVMNVSCGPLVYDNTIVFPEWLEWTFQNTGDTVKVWTTDTSLNATYDEYDIVIVPPVADVDTLLRPISEVQVQLALRGPKQMLDFVDTAKEKKPETVLKIEPIEWENPVDTTMRLNTDWYAIIYGPAGNTTENIKQAIKDYIKNHTKATDDAWKLVLPDLFRLTIMYVLPRWDQLAILGRSTYASIYSPVQGVSDAVEFTKVNLSVVSDAHIADNLQTTWHRFRSVTLNIIGGMDNKDNKYKFTDYYADYIAESTDSQDFRRQSDVTKTWTVDMESLLMAAESWSAGVNLATGTTTFRVGDVQFVAKKINGIEYAVATKSNYL